MYFLPVYSERSAMRMVHMSMYTPVIWKNIWMRSYAKEQNEPLGTGVGGHFVQNEPLTPSPRLII